jgi:23S rRNA (adenine2503-C2)-methyltransferase
MHAVNDQIIEVNELANFARRFPCKINLIEYNPIAMAGFTPTSEAGIDYFAQSLSKLGLIVNIRRSRGKDIDAACGQLANKALNQHVEF